MRATEVLPSSYGSDSDLLANLVDRLGKLEANNAILIKENSILQQRLENLESQIHTITKTSEDLSMKVAVLRESGLKPSAHRVFSIFELLEQILILCPTKQLFDIQKVCKTFENVVLNSPALQSRTFRNAKDAVSHTESLEEWSLNLWPILRLNRFFGKESWQRHPNRYSLCLRRQQQEFNFRITDQLIATFEYRITSIEDTKDALEAMSTSLGRSYLTQPALPTSVWVSFLDKSILQDKREYILACRSPATVPPNVTAEARVRAATVLQLLQVANLLWKSHSRKWKWDEERDIWVPENEAQEDEETLGLITEKPVYSGWRVVQPRSGRYVFET